MKRTILLLLCLALLISLKPIESFGYAAGRAGNTGSPGSQNCTQCHTGTVNTGPGSVTITSNIPGWQYSAGQTYTINVTVSQTGLPLFSLGVEALSGSGTYANAGTFVITNSSETQIKSRSVGGFSRNNVVQVTNGGLASNSKTFTFNWTAPATNVGDVTFYVCGLACDNNGGTENDFSYTISQVVPFMSAAAPVAAFNASSSSVCENESITFTDQSTNTPTSWAWDFGDSQTSTDQNPVHSYAAAGNYTVTLTATNAGGNNSTTTSITVNPTLVPSVIINPSATNVCPGTSVLLTAVPTNGGNATYSWTVDGNVVGTSDTYSAVFTNGQAVICTLTSDALCASPTTATANFTTGVYTVAPVTITLGSGTLYSDATTGNQWYEQTSGILTGETGQIFSPSANGNYYTIVTDANGCTSVSNVISFTLSMGKNEINDGISIYPNPSNGLINISLSHNISGLISIKDYTGKEVYQETIDQNNATVKSFDLSMLSNGIYVIILNDQKIKLVLNK